MDSAYWQLYNFTFVVVSMLHSRLKEFLLLIKYSRGENVCLIVYKKITLMNMFSLSEHIELKKKLNLFIKMCWLLFIKKMLPPSVFKEKFTKFKIRIYLPKSGKE